MADRAKGKVSQIYAGPDRIYVELRGISDEETPGGDGSLFFLQPAHPVFNSLYSLILVAATNQYGIIVRVVGEIKPKKDNDPGENAEISYIVVDVPALP